jgi:hypothetical protein
VRLIKLGGRKIRTPDLAHLAGLDQVCKRGQGVADRGRWVRSMELVEVDVVSPEAAQAVLQGTLHVLRGGTGALGA